MNIGFFTDTYYPQVNGVTYTLDAWRKELQKRGHEVTIYYPAGDYEPGEGEVAYPSVPLWFYSGYRVAMPLRIRKATRHLDVVHEHGLYGMAIAGLRAARAHNTPRMLTFHTPGDEYLDYLPLSGLLKGAYRGAYMMWERWLLNRFQHVTTGSPVIKERLQKNGIRDVEVLSNGLELPLFQRTDPKEFRKRHGITAGKVIGFCGRLGYEKHVEDLIRAADDFDGQVVIAGDGPARQHYEELAKDKENVKFLGFLPRDTLNEFYSAIDVFVFPSFCETQGLVAVESMACATPVVAVPVLALKATVTKEKTGYHYRPGDTRDLLGKVNACYENMEELGRCCLAEADRNSVDKTVDRLEEIYASLGAQPASSRSGPRAGKKRTL